MHSNIGNINADANGTHVDPLDQTPRVPGIRRQSLLSTRKPPSFQDIEPQSQSRKRSGQSQQGQNTSQSQAQTGTITGTGTFPAGILSSGEESDLADGYDAGIRKSLEIDMKELVGDAVGNMSISPASRDVVLAARRGLFIIDLEAPFEVPRFLPQGGTWDVADVQWNPHPSRANYVVSTSSEKLLIWNLDLPGQTSIEHILHSHYRAITDLNWHTTERDTVVSTGIDSWVWAWDLRETRKPIFGLCAFNSPGTQVKWNRQNPNILASSHSNTVLIWDRRKGSLPITTINGHTSRIYGIDWSHTASNEIVTCSLDKTIKLWNINECGGDRASECTPSSFNSSNSINVSTSPTSLPNASRSHSAKFIINTTYPVWRARNLPFGKGVLSLAQRGETALEMYAIEEEGEKMFSDNVAVKTFEGHTDVVKEFVWRRGGHDDSEYQLITWSKDRTLRFWPMDSESMRKVGRSPPARGRSASTGTSKTRDHTIKATKSFRNLPEELGSLPLLSAPIGNRAILAEVRAGIPSRRRNDSMTQQYPAVPIPRPLPQDLASSSSLGISSLNDLVSLSSTVKIYGPLSGTGGTMSRGAAGNKSRAKVDALSWLSWVKVREGKRAGSSSGPGSRGDSGEAGKDPNYSGAKDEKDAVTGEKRKRSESRVRPGTDERDTNQLQDEITSVLNKLGSSKVKLEKHDLTKKRTCTLGLQVPWGENSTVFLRITFTFPRDYPNASHPDGTPTINLEHTPLITIQDRAFILRRLRTIRETNRPCLEACLRFLLYHNEDEKADITFGSESSDDDEPSSKKEKEVTMSLLRNNKNLAEPRTSQGSFGPNGRPFLAPPRLVRNVVSNLSITPSKNPETPSAGGDEPVPRLFQSPSLVSDAIRRLSLAATDRASKSVESRRAESGDHITRIMTNLLTFPRHRRRRESDSVRSESVSNHMAMVAPRRSTVVIRNTTTIAGGDRRVAVDYIFMSNDVVEVCDTNASVARSRGRYDHERIFKALTAVLGTRPDSTPYTLLTKQILQQTITTLRAQKDVQMLAMVAAIILQSLPKSLPLSQSISRLQTPISSARFSGVLNTPKFAHADYFGMPKSLSGLHSPLSPTGTSRVPPSPQPSISISSTSSRGSWSSLFNTGTMRHFMAGVQDTLKDGLSNSTEIAPTAVPGRWVAVPRSDKILRGPDSPIPRQAPWKESLPATPPTVSKSWNEMSMPSPPNKPAFSSAGHRKSSFLHRNGSHKMDKEKWTVMFRPAPEANNIEPIFNDEEIDFLIRHIYFYAEILFRWELTNKRLELLKSVNAVDPHHNGTSNTIDRVVFILRKFLWTVYVFYLPVVCSRSLHQLHTLPSRHTHLLLVKTTITSMSYRLWLYVYGGWKKLAQFGFGSICSKFTIG
ncbi:hypothetical protein K435DRAFT_848204 [Dendrothele bispora CBS 962.96]|uniref:Uncharacterized protein n=1 Tax=Dendrothele bispora (strain CBS 962.96) TaxID=1314807 RepID=A0A4S8MXP5_DENBC|nr:hypothetical protein K435DRAFT_848204 [Dendrothele bispora CBS 962.96]